MKCRVDLQEQISHTPMVLAWAAVYEQEYGQKPGEMVLRIAEHILKVGKMLTELGKKDALESKGACSATFFYSIGCKSLSVGYGESP